MFAAGGDKAVAVGRERRSASQPGENIDSTPSPVATAVLLAAAALLWVYLRKKVV